MQTSRRHAMGVWLVGVLLFALTACGDDAEGETRGPSVSFGSRSARACDLLFDIGEATTVSVRFVDVRGASFQRGASLGVSVAATRDAPLPNGSVLLEVRQDAEPKLTTTHCYDREGRALDDPGVRLSR